MKKIVISGGHLTPSLLVIDELKKRGDWQFFYLGRKHTAEGDKTLSWEAKMVPKKGVTFLPLTAGRIQQKLTRYTLSALLRLPLGFFQAFYYLLKIKPDVVLSFGSYVSVPVVFSAWVLHIPVLSHQQTLVKGKADKINSRLAKKIAVSWTRSLEESPKKKKVLTGLPFRQDIFKVGKKLPPFLKINPELPFILITGGNQGSHFINLAVEGSLKKLLKRYNVLHQTGSLKDSADFNHLNKIKNKLPKELRERYHLETFLTGSLWPKVLNRADLVVSRAGINTVIELLALKKPSLLIPIPWLFNDEQTVNAHMMKNLGLAEILEQDKLNSDNLYNLIDKMTDNLKNYKLKQQKETLITNAAERIADELEKLA